MSNKAAGTIFRNDVLDYFHQHGFIGMTRAPESALGAWANGNIHTRLPLTLRACNERDIALSSQVDRVQAEARLVGNRTFFTIQARRGRGVREAYAITTVDVLIELLRQLYPEAACRHAMVADL